MKAAGRAARKALESRVMGREVTQCRLNDEQGKYGRYLVKTFVGDKLINDWLLAGTVFHICGIEAQLTSTP